MSNSSTIRLSQATAIRLAKECAQRIAAKAASVPQLSDSESKELIKIISRENVRSPIYKEAKEKLDAQDQLTELGKASENAEFYAEFYGAAEATPPLENFVTVSVEDYSFLTRFAAETKLIVKEVITD